MFNYFYTNQKLISALIHVVLLPLMLCLLIGLLFFDLSLPLLFHLKRKKKTRDLSITCFIQVIKCFFLLFEILGYMISEIIFYAFTYHQTPNIFHHPPLILFYVKLFIYLFILFIFYFKNKNTN